MAIPSFNLGNGKWASKENAILGYKQNSEGVYGAIEGDVTRASTKTRINASGLIEEVPIGVASIDYLDSVNGALKCEPQSTNLVKYSNDFTNAAWSKTAGVTITSNAIIAPDGTLTADYVQMGAINRVINQITSFVDLVPVTGSIYIKGTSGETIQIASGGSDELFILNGNWQRLESTQTNINGSFNVNTFGGSTALDFYIWGAQLEALSYPTSYIPTSGATATRIADVVDNFGTVNDFNSSEGVLYFDAEALAENVTNRTISISDGTVNNFVNFIYFSTSSAYRIAINSGGVDFQFAFGNITQTDRSKFALAWGGGTLKLYINGVESLSIAATSPLALNTLNLADYNLSNVFHAKIYGLQVYKELLTPAELITLTT